MTNENDLQSAPLNISGLINYQAGSVVSKTIVSKKTGNVTLFAFDAGQGLSEHTAPFDAMVNIIDGEAEVTLGGKIQTVKAGEMIILPANIAHALKAVNSFKMILTMIKS